jgi:hypothetical protein
MLNELGIPQERPFQLYRNWSVSGSGFASAGISPVKGGSYHNAPPGVVRDFGKLTTALEVRFQGGTQQSTATLTDGSQIQLPDSNEDIVYQRRSPGDAWRLSPHPMSGGWTRGCSQIGSAYTSFHLPHGGSIRVGALTVSSMASAPPSPPTPPILPQNATRPFTIVAFMDGASLDQEWTVGAQAVTGNWNLRGAVHALCVVSDGRIYSDGELIHTTEPLPQGYEWQLPGTLRVAVYDSELSNEEVEAVSWGGSSGGTGPIAVDASSGNVWNLGSPGNSLSLSLAGGALTAYIDGVSRQSFPMGDTNPSASLLGAEYTALLVGDTPTMGRAYETATLKAPSSLPWSIFARITAPADSPIIGRGSIGNLRTVGQNTPREVSFWCTVPAAGETFLRFPGLHFALEVGSGSLRIIKQDVASTLSPPDNLLGRTVHVRYNDTSIWINGLQKTLIPASTSPLTEGPQLGYGPRANPATTAVSPNIPIKVRGIAAIINASPNTQTVMQSLQAQVTVDSASIYFTDPATGKQHQQLRPSGNISIGYRLSDTGEAFLYINGSRVLTWTTFVQPYHEVTFPVAENSQVLLSRVYDSTPTEGQILMESVLTPVCTLLDVRAYAAVQTGFSWRPLTSPTDAMGWFLDSGGLVVSPGIRYAFSVPPDQESSVAIRASSTLAEVIVDGIAVAAISDTASLSVLASAEPTEFVFARPAYHLEPPARERTRCSYVDGAAMPLDGTSKEIVYCDDPEALMSLSAGPDIIAQNLTGSTISVGTDVLPPGASLFIRGTNRTPIPGEGTDVRYYFYTPVRGYSGGTTDEAETLYDSHTFPSNAGSTVFGGEAQATGGMALQLPGGHTATLTSSGNHSLSLSLGERLVLQSSLDGLVVDAPFDLPWTPTTPGSQYIPGAIDVPHAVSVDMSTPTFTAPAHTQLSVPFAVSTSTFITDEEIQLLIDSNGLPPSQAEQQKVVVWDENLASWDFQAPIAGDIPVETKQVVVGVTGGSEPTSLTMSVGPETQQDSAGLYEPATQEHQYNISSHGVWGAADLFEGHTYIFETSGDQGFFLSTPEDPGLRWKPSSLFPQQPNELLLYDSLTVQDDSSSTDRITLTVPVGMAPATLHYRRSGGGDGYGELRIHACPASRDVWQFPAPQEPHSHVPDNHMQRIAYKRTLDEVIVVGNFRSHTTTTTTTRVFTLPLGYRPNLGYHFGTAVNHLTGEITAVRVDQGGEVQVYTGSGPGGDIGLVQMRFPTDQVGEPPQTIQSLTTVTDVDFTATFNAAGLTVETFTQTYQDPYIRSIATAAGVSEDQITLSVTEGSVKVATSIRDVPDANTFVPKLSQLQDTLNTAASTPDLDLITQLSTNLSAVESVNQSSPRATGTSFDEDTATISLDMEPGTTGFTATMTDVRGTSVSQDKLPINWFEKALVGPFRLAVSMRNVFGSSEPILTDAFGPVEGQPVDATSISVTWSDTHAHISWTPPQDTGGLRIRHYVVSAPGYQTTVTSPNATVPWETLPLGPITVSSFTRWNIAAGDTGGTLSQPTTLQAPAVTATLTGTLDSHQRYQYRVQASAGGLTITPQIAVLNHLTSTTTLVTPRQRGVGIDSTGSIQLDPDTNYTLTFTASTVTGTQTDQKTLYVPELSFVEHGSIQNAFSSAEPQYIMTDQAIPDGAGSTENMEHQPATSTPVYIREFHVYTAKGPDNSQPPTAVRLLAKNADDDPWALLGTLTNLFYDASTDAPWGEQGVNAPPPGTSLTVHSTAGTFRHVRVEADQGGGPMRVAWQVDYARVSPSVGDPSVSLKSLETANLEVTATFVMTGGYSLNYSFDSETLNQYGSDVIVSSLSSYGSHRLRYRIGTRPTQFVDFVLSYNPAHQISGATFDLDTVYVSGPGLSFPRFPTPSEVQQPYTPGAVVGVAVDGTPIVPSPQGAAPELSETGKDALGRYVGLPFHIMGHRNRVPPGPTLLLDGSTLVVREGMTYPLDLFGMSPEESPEFTNQDNEILISLVAHIGGVYTLHVPIGWTATKYTGGNPGLVTVLPQADLVSQHLDQIGAPLGFALDGFPIYGAVGTDDQLVSKQGAVTTVVTHEYPSGTTAYFCPVALQPDGTVATEPGFPVPSFSGILLS